MKNSKLIITIIIVAILLTLGLSFAQTFSPNNQQKSTKNEISEILPSQTDESESQAVTISADGKTISYQGQDGKTALEILQSLTKVEAEDSSFGPMIKSINGQAQTDNEFWTYTVDGKMGNVGAQQYQTKDGEKIEWKLSGL